MNQNTNRGIRHECILLFQKACLKSHRQQWLLSSSADRLSCEGLPATQEEIRNASISETHSRVLLIQIQFLVSCSLLKQIFLLLCKNNNGSWLPVYVSRRTGKKVLLPSYSEKATKYKVAAKSLPWVVRFFVNSCLITVSFCFISTPLFLLFSFLDVIYFMHKSIEDILLTAEESCGNVKGCHVMLIKHLAQAFIHVTEVFRDRIMSSSPGITLEDALPSLPSVKNT